MNSYWYFYIILIFLITLTNADPADGSNDRVQLKIIKHQSCYSKPGPNELIRFASSESAPLLNDPDNGPGCYIIKGPVRVLKSIKGPVQCYVRVRTVGIHNPPEKCTHRDASGCGGFGSCLYCDMCSSEREVERRTGSEVRIEEGGRGLDCVNGVRPGNHTNIAIRFCMPPERELLKIEAISKETFRSNSQGTRNSHGHFFFMDIYCFNKAVNQYSLAQIDQMAKDDNDDVMVCHKVVGLVSRP